MIARICMVAVAAASLALAQSSPIDQPTASISGVVRDKVTKQPLANYVVDTSGNRRVTTDSSGKYRLSGLPPGTYRIDVQASERFLSQATRMIVLAGQDLDNINIDVPIDGSISGRVLDENGEPVPGLWVQLVSHEYYLGSAGYFYAGQASSTTDDQGRYTIGRIPPGLSFLLMAAPKATRIPAHSQVPLNPNFRKRVTVRTWYPNSPSREGAAPLVLQPGEHREGADIEVKRSPNYCVEGTAMGPNGAAEMAFNIEALQPSSGSNSHGGTFVMAPNGKTGPDGKLRICDLSPGQYRVVIETAHSASEPVASFGVTYLTVKDEDQRGVRFMTSPGRTLEAEVAWDGASPEDASQTKLSLHLRPTLRTGFPGLADWDAKDVDIPGKVSFENLFFDEYQVQTRFRGPSQGLYIKDITYGGRSVLHEPLRYGSAMEGSGLRVVVARDGGTLAARVADKDGNPIADARVVLFPADAASEGALAATMVTGQTDQLGRYTSKILPPASYYVFAGEEDFDASIESVAKLWRSRTTLQKVELAPGGSPQVNLELVTLM